MSGPIGWCIVVLFLYASTGSAVLFRWVGTLSAAQRFEQPNTLPSLGRILPFPAGSAGGWNANGRPSSEMLIAFKLTSLSGRSLAVAG
jgi:hypothetical protein